MTKTKVLVTGGSGLVGSAINKIACNYEYDFLFINSNDCDLTDYISTISLFETFKPDYVIHLAARVGGLFKNMNFKVDMYEKNTLINYIKNKMNKKARELKKLIESLKNKNKGLKFGMQKEDMGADQEAEIFQAMLMEMQAPEPEEPPVTSS